MHVVHVIKCFSCFGFVGSAPLRWLLVALSGDYSSLRCKGFLSSGFPCCRAWMLGAQACSRCSNAGSVVVAYGLCVPWHVDFPGLGIESTSLH